MGKTKIANRKKVVRIDEKMADEIGQMKEMGFSLRKIARAVGLTHPAVLYFLKGRKKIINQSKNL